MKVFFGIARGNDGFINKIALRERCGKELFRLYRYSCLIEGDITVCGALCQTRFCRLVIVPAALASAEIQRGAIFFGEERECQSVALLAEFICVSLRADKDKADIFIPEEAEASPACRHHVGRAVRLCRSDKHPVFAYETKRIFVPIFG